MLHRGRRITLTAALLLMLLALAGCGPSIVKSDAQMYIQPSEYQAMDKVLLIGPTFSYIPLKEQMKEGRVSYRTRYLFDRETFNSIILLARDRGRDVDLYLPNLVTLNYYAEVAGAEKLYDAAIMEPGTDELGKERMDRLGAVIKKVSERIDVDAYVCVELALVALDVKDMPQATGSAALEVLKSNPKLKAGLVLYAQMLDRTGRLLWLSHGVYARLKDTSTEDKLQAELHSLLSGKSITEHREFFMGIFELLVMNSREDTGSYNTSDKPMP